MAVWLWCNATLVVRVSLTAACGITVVSIAIGTFLIAPPALSEAIKKSSSGICHSADSPYYAKTKNFTAFHKLAACLDSGGGLPKGQSVAADRKLTQ